MTVSRDATGRVTGVTRPDHTHATGGGYTAGLKEPCVTSARGRRGRLPPRGRWRRRRVRLAISIDKAARAADAAAAAAVQKAAAELSAAQLEANALVGAAVAAPGVRNH